MAYLPGTGPADTVCADCDYLYVLRKFARCRKAAELRRVSVLKMQPIQAMTYSCKFFEPRKAGDAA